MEQIEIAIGTYENHIIGYRVEKKVEGGFTLESSFTTDSHRGALRCLAVSPQGVLASSSTDDSIRLHSLKKRKEVGGLFQHDGSVNCIRFFRGGHMFSASEDGTICLWKCKNWELLRLLKGHKCHVMAVAVHPSAKLGLSVGSDRSFFTWDLTTGKLAFKRKTENVVQDILFTQDGNNYVLVYQKKIEVCSLEDTMVVEEIDFASRINSVCFVGENILGVGSDDGKVSIVNVLSGEQLLQETFKGRVRSLHVLSTKTDILLFIASSNGCIRVCKLDLTEGSEMLDTVLTYESGVRITCMTAYAPPEILKEEVRKKDKRRRKRKTFEDAEDETPNMDVGANDEEKDSNKESGDEIEEPSGEKDSEDELSKEEEDSDNSDSESHPRVSVKKDVKKKKSGEVSSIALKSEKRKPEKSLKKKQKSKSEESQPRKKKKVT